jgi:hypothetical protein
MPENDLPRRDNQISVRYQFDEGQYELSSTVDSTTVSEAEAAQNWLEEQYLAVETFLDTHQVLTDLAKDIHGLGPKGFATSRRPSRRSMLSDRPISSHWRRFHTLTTRLRRRYRLRLKMSKPSLTTIRRRSNRSYGPSTNR